VISQMKMLRHREGSGKRAVWIQWYDPMTSPPKELRGTKTTQTCHLWRLGLKCHQLNGEFPRLLGSSLEVACQLVDLTLPFRLSLVEVGRTLVNRCLQCCDVGLESLVLLLQLLSNTTITNDINIGSQSTTVSSWIVCPVQTWGWVHRHEYKYIAGGWVWVCC